MQPENDLAHKSQRRITTHFIPTSLNNPAEGGPPRRLCSVPQSIPQRWHTRAVKHDASVDITKYLVQTRTNYFSMAGKCWFIFKEVCLTYSFRDGEPRQYGGSSGGSPGCIHLC